MLDSLLQTGIVQNLLKYLIWAFITGIFFSGVLVILESRLKSSCLKKVAYFFSFAGLLYLILIILSGSVEFEGTEKPSSLRLSSFNLDAFQKLPQLSQTIETIYVVGWWILLGGSLCSGLFIIIRRQFPKYKILNISYLFSFFGPILFVFLVWNKSLEVEDWEITGLNASWYQKAAENGNPWALVELGQCFLEGRGVKKNEEKAFKLFKKAADQGNLHAQLNVGFSYMNGIGVAKDEKKSFEWYSKAAERGDLDGQAKLGLFYENGEGVAQDYKEAFKWYTKAAEQGDDFAQTKLGLFYEEGRGVTQDHKEAVKWYKKTAEQGYAFAQVNLGRCYANGTGVVKDDTEAMKLYTKAAEQGDAYGQFLLGRRYLSGKGVAKDEKKAFEWLFKSAEQGNVDGQNSVGRCYGMGIGVAKDEKEAIKWLSRAADQNDPYGLSGVAWIFSTSNDPDLRNGKEAVKLAQEAIQISAKPDSYLISVLAAAYAEQGDFEMAVTTQAKAISILTDKSREKEFQAELKSYKDKKPWRTQESLSPQPATNPQQNL